MVQYPVSDEEMQEILQQIIDLGQLLGWSSAMAQDKNNAILGLYIGEESWINAKIGNSTKTTH